MLPALVFLAIYVGAYGGVNFYILWKLRTALALSGWPMVLVAAVFVLLVAAPVATLILERYGHWWIARATAVIGFPWMPLAMWLFLLLLAGDAWNLGVKVAAHWSPGAERLALAPKMAALAAGVITACLGAYALWSANDIRIERLDIKTARWAPDAAPVRIALVSDLHLDLLEGRHWLSRVTARVEEARPDVIVCTGDVLDEPAGRRSELAAQLAALQPPLGKFAAFGNHEHYRGIVPSRRFLEDAGFRVLCGESVSLLDGRLRLAGADDFADHQEPAAGRAQARAGEDAALPAARSTGRGEFVVLLKHRPAVNAASAGRFDLQLSGHTHAGQVFPFAILARLANGRLSGRYPLPGGADLYVTRGTGTWGPPMRFLAPPEVTLIVVEPAGT